ncbi:MAG: FtsH protease activity modulator HflK [Synergistaceae bacterium]|jgi:membrane protease subunit HflK|nr:FtsH protease activity modulator HflK [Synergistaceae bacterium]
MEEREPERKLERELEYKPEYKLKKAFERGAKFLKPALAAVCLVSLSFLCTYKVESDEIAVVLRFGRLTGETPAERIKRPGLHFAFPHVIDEVVKIPVGKVKQVTVATHYANGSAIDIDINRNGYLITGDSNILLAEAAVKYRIGDPLAYALYHEDAERVIDGTVSGVLQKHVSRLGVDELLTTGKVRLAEDVRRGAQALLDAVKSGVALTNVELTALAPPEEVMSDFNAVIAAAAQKETSIQQADGYRVNTLPAAQSKARQLAENAKSRQNEAIAAARTDTAAFNGLYARYAQNPDVVNEGVFRSRLGALLPKMRVVVRGDETAPRLLLP